MRRGIFFIDLVFYNRVLRCLVAFELKTGKFKPEYAFQNIGRGMGAAKFRTSQKVPDNMKGILPDAKELAKLL